MRDQYIESGPVTRYEVCDRNYGFTKSQIEQNITIVRAINSLFLRFQRNVYFLEKASYPSLRASYPAIGVNAFLQGVSKNTFSNTSHDVRVPSLLWFVDKCQGGPDGKGIKSLSLETCGAESTFQKVGALPHSTLPTYVLAFFLPHGSIA